MGELGLSSEERGQWRREGKGAGDGGWAMGKGIWAPPSWAQLASPAPLSWTPCRTASTPFFQDSAGSAVSPARLPAAREGGRSGWPLSD